AAAFGCTVGSACRILLSLGSFRLIANPPFARWKGWAALSFNFLTRDRRTASPLSSPQRPMDHVFLRGHSPPKSTRPLPSMRRIGAKRFYAHRGDTVPDRFFPKKRPRAPLVGGRSRRLWRAGASCR